MAKKAKNKNWSWLNIKLNASKRLEKAKRQGKSENYIKDLELHLSKLR